MASAAYRQWLTAGRPYTLILPAKHLQANVRRHGLTVYDFPNDAHLTAATPEDHTPFSATGWPSGNARWNARGLDIMPRDGSAAARVENARIARQIIADKDAGVAGTEWIKYLNFTDEQGRCWHVRWTPTKDVAASSDAGHIHISGRSDHDTWAGAIAYDPVARMNAPTPTPTPAPSGDDMSQADVDAINRKLDALLAATPVWGEANARPMQPNVLADLVKGIGVPPSTATIAAAVSAAVGALKVTLAADQLGALTTAVSQAVAAHADTPLGEQDKPAIEEAVEVAVRHVLATGVDATPSA